jgi:hypothetical protein
MKLLLSVIVVLNICSADIIGAEKKLLDAASNASVSQFANLLSQSINWACVDEKNNNILHKLAMRQDNGVCFIAGVRIYAKHNYHQLIIQPNSNGDLPLDVLLKSHPADAPAIEKSFYSALLNLDDKSFAKEFDEEEKYFWSKVHGINLYNAHQLQKIREQSLRSKPY